MLTTAVARESAAKAIQGAIQAGVPLDQAFAEAETWMKGRDWVSAMRQRIPSSVRSAQVQCDNLAWALEEAEKKSGLSAPRLIAAVAAKVHQVPGLGASGLQDPGVWAATLIAEYGLSVGR